MTLKPPIGKEVAVKCAVCLRTAVVTIAEPVSPTPELSALFTVVRWLKPPDGWWLAVIRDTLDTEAFHVRCPSCLQVPLNAPVASGDVLALKQVQELAQKLADEACGPLLEQEKDYQTAVREIEKIAVGLRKQTRKDVIREKVSKLRDLIQAIEGYAE